MFDRKSADTEPSKQAHLADQRDPWRQKNCEAASRSQLQLRVKLFSLLLDEHDGDEGFAGPWDLQ